MSVETASLTSLETALRYARMGWPVFAVNEMKKPLTPHGFHDATRDEVQITRWWTQYPDAGIAVPTGEVSGLVVLDVDIDAEKKLDGPSELYRLTTEHGPLPPGPRSRTGRGGSHLFFQHPSERVPCSNSKIAPGLDVKGDGGYVVVPESPHELGTLYEWVSNPEECPLPALPDWLKTEMQRAGCISLPSTGDGGPIPKGVRNSKLARIAGRFRREGLGEAEIAEPLLRVNQQRCAPPLPNEEVRRIARSVAHYSAPPEDRHSTDLANARLFVEQNADTVRYVSNWHKWLVWDGCRWREDDDGEVHRLAKATVESLYGIAAAVADDQKRRDMRRHALASESASRIRSLLELARTEQGVVTTSERLDTDKWLLNVANGTIDLRTGDLREHRSSDLITRVVAAPYVPTAACDRWKEFLSQIMGGNKRLVAFLQRAVGYSLTGSTQEQAMFLMYGTGANGKSTFLGVLKDLLGGYFRACPSDTLLVRNSSSVSNDLARLKSARLISSCEGEENRFLAESLIKLFTGGDAVTARFLYGEFFEFTPEGKVWFATNHKPRVRGTDEAIWRRLRLIPFSVTIPEPDRDGELPDKLRAELPGILAWAVRGCLRWQAKGLLPPPEVLTATATYRKEEDRIAAFVAERCSTGKGKEAGAGDLYVGYRGWAESSGEKPVSQTMFGRRLDEMGFSNRKTRGVKLRQGIELKPVVMPPT